MHWDICNFFFNSVLNFLCLLQDKKVFSFYSWIEKVLFNVVRFPMEIIQFEIWFDISHNEISIEKNCLSVYF